MLLRPRRIAEVWWISGGVLALLLFRAFPLATAVHAVLEGRDVYFFLIGMMLLAELAREVGVFAWLAGLAARLANGSPTRLFSMTYVVGVLVTAFMSNDATAVVLTPAVLALTRACEIDPVPHLFACALIANAASFLLPISNPANLVVFQHGMPALFRWLAAFAFPSALAIIATYLVLRIFFQRELAGAIRASPERAPLSGHARATLGALGAVIVILFVASARGAELGLPTLIAAAVAAGLVCLSARMNPWSLLRRVNWGVLILVGGLFVMATAVERAGLLQATERWLSSADQLPPLHRVLAVGGAVGVANNLINNLPLGLLAEATLHAAHPTVLSIKATLLGIDLGPNLSVTGSLATILWLSSMRRDGVDVSFGRFLRVGVVAMPIALVSALLASLVTANVGAP